MDDAPNDAPNPDKQINSSLSAGTTPLTRVPVEITVSVGRARPLIGDLIRMTPDSVLPLDRKVDDPVELYIGDKLVARGVLTETEVSTDGQLAVKLTEVSNIQDSL